MKLVIWSDGSDFRGVTLDGELVAAEQVELTLKLAFGVVQVQLDGVELTVSAGDVEQRQVVKFR